MSNIKEEIYEIALTESQMECDELKAHIERLLEAILASNREIDIGKASKILMDAVSLTPAQSLNHIKAQAIEEYQKAIKVGLYFIDSNVLDIGDDLISKYKEQSDD